MDCAIYPVVVIRQDDTCLCGELIQTVAERDICWLRPLALYQVLACCEEIGMPLDLRNGPDVICSSTLVEPAIDIEWLTILQWLNEENEPCNFAQANHYLRQFLAKLPPPLSSPLVN